MRKAISLIVFLGVVTTLGLQAEIRGVAMTRDGLPLAGAEVTVHTLESSSAAQARLLSEDPTQVALVRGETTRTGSFSLKVDAPVVIVMIRKDGFAPTAVRMLKDEDIGAIPLRRAEPKTGKVRGPQGAVSGARVIWSGRGGAQVVSITNEKGEYSVPDPAVWGSTLTVIGPDHAILEKRTTGLGPTASPPELDASLDAGIDLEGRVVASDGKTPVAGAAIYVDSWLLGMSAEDGSFVTKHTSRKWSEVRAVSGDQSASRTRKGKDVVLRLEKTPRLSGVVRDAQSRAPLAGVEVTVAQGEGGFRRLLGVGGSGVSTITDSKGAYSFEVSTGQYGIVARLPGYNFTNASASMVAGDRVDRVLPGRKLARLSGTVLNEDHEGVPASRIVLQRERGGFGPRMVMSRPASGWSAPDGRFVLRSVEPSEKARFEAEKKGFPSGRTEPIPLAQGENREGVIITIPTGVEVSGIVMDRDGIPLAGIAVTSSPARAGRGRGMRMILGGQTEDDTSQIMTANDGSFMTRVVVGATDFSFKGPGYSSKRVSGVEVAPGLEPLEVTMTPGVSIEGRVVRADGSGVEGVDVMALSEGGMLGGLTLSDGSFAIENLTPGAMMIMATKEDDFIQQMRRVTAPESELVIELPPGETIRGIVVDKETGDPVTDFQAGVQNNLRGGGMRVMGPTNTRTFRADSGEFVLENVPVGPLQLVITAPGFVDHTVPGLVLEEGKPITDLEVSLDQGTTITGRVTSADGRAVQGAIVRIASDEDDGPMGRVFGGTPADAEGNFEIAAVEGGEKTITFSADGYLDETKTVEVSGRDLRVDATLGKGSVVNGVVSSETGQPVADAIVSMRSGGIFGNQTRTDSNGNFTFDGVEPGRHSFEARKSGLADGLVEDFDVRTGGAVRIVMPIGATISGAVRGVEESEYSKIQVVASSSEGDASAMVNSIGEFKIDGAPTGSVQVWARVTGFGGSSSEREVVEVQSGSQAIVDLEFRTDTLVSGRVTKNGQPLDGAMIRFSPKSPAIQTRTTVNTDTRGDYEATGLAPGEYDVIVLGMQNLSPYTTSTNVDSSTTFDIDIETSRVDGRVVDMDSGQAIVGAQIRLQPKGQADGFLVSREADSDPSGNFILDDIAPGMYSARAIKSGYGQQVFDLEVAATGASGVDFKLASNDGSRVRAVDARDGRALDAFARVTDGGGQGVWEGSLRNSDEGTKIPLAPGSYAITVWASGYAPVTTSVSSPSQSTAIGMTPGGKLQIRSTEKSARSARLVSSYGVEYQRSYFSRQSGLRVDPGTTMVDQIAPGTYSLQLLGEDGSVETTYPVTIAEGQVSSLNL